MFVLGVSLKIFKKGVGMVPIVLYKDKLGNSKLYYQEEKEEGRPTERPAQRHRCDAVKA